MKIAQRPVSPAPAPRRTRPRATRAVRERTLALAAPLSAEDCQVQSMPDASPTKWHLAHTTWFFETFVLEPHEPGFAPFDPAFRVLFNSLLPRRRRAAPAAAARPAHAARRWPRCWRYRAHVDERMQRAARARGDEPASCAALVELGLHHEQQHQELLLTDIKHALSLQPAARRPTRRRWPIDAGAARSRCAGSRIDGGLRRDRPRPGARRRFCFDNETPRHRVCAARRSSSPRARSRNGEFLAFIDDGGYRRPELWLSMGWDWVRGGAARARRSTGEQRDGALARPSRCRAWSQVDPHTPVCHVSYFEADAFARWAGARLPTEAEWELRRARALRRVDAATSSTAARSTRCRAASAAGRRAGADVRRRLGVDRSRATPPYPGYRAAAGRARRVQRQVHVQPVRAARRLVRHAAPATSARATATSSRPTRVAVQRPPPGARRLTATGAQLAQHAQHLGAELALVQHVDHAQRWPP